MPGEDDRFEARAREHGVERTAEGAASLLNLESRKAARTSALFELIRDVKELARECLDAGDAPGTTRAAILSRVEARSGELDPADLDSVRVAASRAFDEVLAERRPGEGD